MPDYTDFTGYPKIPLPGLANGTVMAVKMGNENPFFNNYWAIFSPEYARVVNGNIFYFGNSLLYVIGDQTIVWTKLITPLEGRLITVAQLYKVPISAYYRQIRMEPIPDGPADNVVQEVSGLLMLTVGWDPTNKYYLSFKGDWCPLFRGPAINFPVAGSGGGFNPGTNGGAPGGFDGTFG